MVRVKKESEWSMIVLNTTLEAAPASAPRDLTVVSKEGDPSLVSLNWQPPKLANGLISGEFFFSSNKLKLFIFPLNLIKKNVKVLFLMSQRMWIV